MVQKIAKHLGVELEIVRIDAKRMANDLTRMVTQLDEPLAVSKLIAANDAGKVDASYTLLSLLCVEIWCRSFLDVREG